MANELVRDMDIEVVRKPTSFIQMTQMFGDVSIKLLNTLIYLAQVRVSGDDIDQLHTVNVDIVFGYIGWGTYNNTHALKKHLVELQTAFQWNEYGEDKSTAWSSCTFISFGNINKGLLTYRINPDIVKHVINPRLFAQIPMKTQGCFSKRHSQILYEYFSDARCRDRRRKSINVSIAFLVSHMDLHGDYYLQYKFFRRDVLKPAVDEINKHSDLYINFTPVRKGRKTTDLDFEISHNPVFQHQLPLGDKGDVDVDFDDHLNIELLNLAENQGVDRSLVIMLLAAHGYNRCKTALGVMTEFIASGGSIRSVDGFFRSSVVNSYELGKSNTATSRHQAKISNDKLREQQSEDESAYLSYIFQLAKEAFLSRSKTFKTRRMNVFVDTLKTDRFGFIAKEYKKHGWESKVIWSCFLSEEFIIELNKNNPKASYEYYCLNVKNHDTYLDANTV